MKQLGFVVGPIVGVAAIVHYAFGNPMYTQISVGATIIILYIIRLEMKLWRLEKNA